MRKGWHIAEADGVWTLSRHAEARFDLRAETWLPICHPVRLMHQIRQDIWRALQRLRGFAPAVRLATNGGVWMVQAGGQVKGRMTEAHRSTLETVLWDEQNRTRWVRYAGAWPEGDA